MLTLQGSNHRVRSLAYAPDGAVLASGDGPVIRIWDPISGKEQAAVPSRQRVIHALTFAPDGMLLATAGSNRVVILWFLKDPLPRVVLHGHTVPVAGLAFSPDGRFLISVGGQSARGREASGEALVWDIESGRHVHSLRLRGHQFLDVAWAPDGHRVALATDRGLMIFWSPFTPPHNLRIEQLPTLTERLLVNNAAGEPIHLEGQLGFVVLVNDPLALAYAPDGHVMAMANAKTVGLWDMVSGTAVRNLRGHRDRIEAVAYSPEGRFLASAGLDGCVCLWETAGWSEVACHDWGIGRVYCVAFSPGGMTIAAGGDREIVIWDVDER